MTVLEKTFASPLDSKQMNPVNAKGTSPKYSSEGTGRTDAEAATPVLWHMMQRANSLEKTLMLGRIEARRRRRWQKMKSLDGITNSKDMSLSQLQKIVKGREVWHVPVHGVAKSRTQLSNSTTIITSLLLQLGTTFSIRLELSLTKSHTHIEGMFKLFHNIFILLEQIHAFKILQNWLYFQGDSRYKWTHTEIYI